MTKREINNLSDIKLLVDSFYAKVKEDELLAEIFNNVIRDNWTLHLEKMYRFWQTVLLNEFSYKGSPFPPHTKLPVSKEHFNRWVNLFNATVNEHFTGTNAEEAKNRAEKIAVFFHAKITEINNKNNTNSI